jgi:uncharacterized protein YegP (UPF0339 family)
MRQPPYTTATRQLRRPRPRATRPPRLRRAARSPAANSLTALEDASWAAKFEMYQDAAGQYRFWLKAGNGEIVATGESYPTQAAAKEGCDAVKTRRRCRHHRDHLSLHNTEQNPPPAETTGETVRRTVFLAWHSGRPTWLAGDVSLIAGRTHRGRPSPTEQASNRAAQDPSSFGTGEQAVSMKAAGWANPTGSYDMPQSTIRSRLTSARL